MSDATSESRASERERRPVSVGVGVEGLGEGAELSVAQLPGLIREWTVTEDALKSLSAEVRERRKRLKVVKSLIVRIMKNRKLGKLDLKKSGKVLELHTKSTKAPITKKFLTQSLTVFFKGDAVQATVCAAFLDEQRPTRSADTLALEAAPHTDAGSTLSE